MTVSGNFVAITTTMSLASVSMGPSPGPQGPQVPMQTVWSVVCPATFSVHFEPPRDDLGTSRKVREMEVAATLQGTDSDDRNTPDTFRTDQALFRVLDLSWLSPGTQAQGRGGQAARTCRSPAHRLKAPPDLPPTSPVTMGPILPLQEAAPVPMALKGRGLAL